MIVGQTCWFSVLWLIALFHLFEGMHSWPHLLAEVWKENLFTPSWFEPKLFYPKKCVSYDKSTYQQNSVKGPKDSNSEREKMPKSNIKFQNGPENANKKREIAILLTFLRKQQIFYPRWDVFLHQHCCYIITFSHLFQTWKNTIYLHKQGLSQNYSTQKRV